ncbi:hypothetical protein [Oceanivirga miroungae]|uniref:Uncharacterized protein n=1 Tax=Oceanivirga miroungae TaxID=1130046 RepID=A0A6I8MBY4_9FUSO|nr:hypothetical protein [Oceanivirga miroungae]VWL84948.1 hypothetical protein OMES3154_00221 [Oceanivirga miroungae]
MNTRISVKETAYILNSTEQFVRIELQRELLPIGICLKGGKSNRFTYYIYLSKLEEYLDKKIDIVDLRKKLYSKGFYSEKEWCKIGEEI